MTDTMRAISLWQPWAALWVAGVKIHETRHWLTEYRGPLAVHAAKRPVDGYLGAPLEAVCEKALGLGWRRRLPLGALVGVVELVDCLPVEAVRRAGLGSVDYLCGNFEPGRYAWRAANPRPLAVAVPWRGRQSFFSVPVSAVQS